MDGKKNERRDKMNAQDKATEIFKKAVEEMSSKQLTNFLAFVYGYMIAKMDMGDVEEFENKLTRMKN